MITSRIPESWRELENAVSQILSECGFDVEVKDRISATRFDVVEEFAAEETVKGNFVRLLCDCRYWTRSISLPEIYAVESAVSANDADIGYIILHHVDRRDVALAPDSGCVRLVSWMQFQCLFENLWYQKYFTVRITDELDPLLIYTEPYTPEWYFGLSESEKVTFLALKHEYAALGWLVASLTRYGRIFRTGQMPRLPIADHLVVHESTMQRIPASVLEAVGFQELLAAILEHGQQAIEEFHEIRNRN
jgi:hypothetical protein